MQNLMLVQYEAFYLLATLFLMKLNVQHCCQTANRRVSRLELNMAHRLYMYVLDISVMSGASLDG